jgi:hypothetical protein
MLGARVGVMKALMLPPRETATSHDFPQGTVEGHTAGTAERRVISSAPSVSSLPSSAEDGVSDPLSPSSNSE